MKILILHRVPYNRIEYHRGIDHTLHDVTYFGKQEIINTLPDNLKCRAIVRPGLKSAFDEASSWLIESAEYFDRVISLSEYELLDAAQLREKFDITGNRVEQTNLVRNKALMKNAVAAAGLKTPAYRLLSEFMQEPHNTSWSGKSIIKPLDGASSVDVIIFETPEHAYTAITQRCSGVSSLDIDQPNYSGYEIEEFIEGPIRHYDGLVQDENVLIMISSEYIGTCLGFMEHGTPLGSYQIATSEATKEWVSAVLKAVKICNGSFHLEAIMDGEQPVFLEVGNRVGGADVVATFELSTGVHLPSQELRLYLDEEIALSELSFSPTHLWYGWFVFAGHRLPTDVFTGVKGAESFRNSAEVISWNELKNNAKLPRHITYSAYEAPLSGVILTNSSQQSRVWIEKLFTAVSLNIKDTTPVK